MSIIHAQSTTKAQSKFQGIQVVMPASTSAFHSDPSSVTVGVRAESDGDLAKRQGGSWSDFGDWVDSKVGLNGADFEVQLTVSSGPNPTSGPSLATYHALSSTNTWTWTASPGEFNSGTWVMTIREIADTGNTDSTTFNWNTEDGS